MEATQALARCAEHPEVPARLTPCTRCGAFACEACFGTVESELCAACRSKAGSVAWEDPSRGLIDRLWSTLTKMWQEPRATFRAVGKGDLVPPATFSLLTLAIGYSPLVLCLPFAGAMMFALVDTFPSGDLEPGMLAAVLGAMTVLMPVYLLVAHAIGVVYFWVTFHLGARLLGGHGDWGPSLRGVLYTSAVAPWNAVILVLAFIPLVGTFVNLGGQLAKLLWTGFALAGTAESVHGLKDDRATIAGFVPGILLVSLFLAMCLLGGLFAFAQRL